jgi:hypothetical protein
MHAFTTATSNGWVPVAYLLGTALTYLVPVVIGMFWGAPLIARELETGTHRLVWNQTVTRTRWLATKLLLLALVAMAFAGLLSLVATLTSARLDSTELNRLEPLLFGARGIVPVAYAAFAFVLGVVAGMVLRRTVPAMAVTMAVYAVCVLAMVFGLRAHLLPAAHLTQAFDSSQMQNFFIDDDNHVLVTQKLGVPGAWVLKREMVTPAGEKFTGPADPRYCGPRIDPQKCVNWVGTLGLRQESSYQPASRFWPLQWAESGLFLALSGLLAAFGFWWLRRRSV